MLERLSTSELQQLIEEDTLVKIEDITPSIPDSGISVASDIYNKRNLKRIFDAFVGKDCFYEKKFRELIFGKCTEREIGELCHSVNIPDQGTFQENVKKLSAIPWKHSDKTSNIIAYLNLPESYLPDEEDRVQGREIIFHPDAPFKALLDFQYKVSEHVIQELSHPYAKLILKMPTGSGKTRTAMEILVKELNQHPEKSILWLAHSEELCQQAVDCFKEVWEHIGTHDIDLMRVWGKNDLQPINGSTFVVAGLQKLYNTIKRSQKSKTDDHSLDLLKQNLRIIVIDEAHKATAPTYKEVINTFSRCNTGVRVLGLTATPGRDYINSDTTKTEELLEFFNDTIIEIEPDDDESVFSFLRKRKILASMQRDPIINSTIIELTNEEKTKIEKFYDYPEGFLKRIGTDKSRNIEIILKLKQECGSGKKILFFGSSLEHSKFICAVLVFLGFKAEHIDGDTRKERRAETISKFKNGDLNVICNFGVLTTGFDAPKTDVIFIARPTLSVVLYSQMIGRGLRGPAIGGTDVCKVIDVVDNIINYPSPDICYEYFKEYGVEG